MAETIKITTLAQLKVALQAAKTYIDGQIDGLGTLAGKSEVAYDDLAAALKTLIDGKAAQATVDTLVGEDTGKSVRTISSEEVAKIVAGADKSYDTLKEIADWILGDTTGAAKMANDITRLDGILAGIGGTDEEATVVAYVTKMINALGIGDYVKITTMTTELGKKVDKVEGSRLMTNAEGTKLAGVAAGAQANVCCSYFEVFLALYLAAMETHSEDKKLLCRLLVIRIQDILSALLSPSPLICY